MLVTTKRSVLIVADTLWMGGEEVSLVALLRNVDYTRFDVTLMLLSPVGDFMNRVPKDVKVVAVPLKKVTQIEKTVGRKRLIADSIRKLRFDIVLREIFYTVCAAIRFPKELRPYEVQCMGVDVKKMPKGCFDVAMAYSSNRMTRLIVARHVRARRKMIWFHSEVSKLTIDPKVEYYYLRGFDVWVSANSKTIAREYRELFPCDAKKIVTLPLMIDLRRIRDLSKEPIEMSLDGQTKIVSVGRLSLPKGFDLAVRVLAKLVESGYDVRWYVAGRGSECEPLKKLAVECGVADRFILLGNMPNPYPLMVACDIYVQPSRYEGYCITLAEARALCRPIVCTKFAGALEQLRDGETGILSDCTVESLTAAIVRLIDNGELRSRLMTNLTAENEEASSMERIYTVWEGK